MVWKRRPCGSDTKGLWFRQVNNVLFEQNSFPLSIRKKGKSKVFKVKEANAFDFFPNAQFIRLLFG